MNTEDIRKICVKKKLVEAVPSLVRFDVDLKREEHKIDFQRRQMLNNYLREKESVLNDFVQINVRTPKSGLSFSPCVTTLRRSSSTKLAPRTLYESDDLTRKRRHLQKPSFSCDLSREKQIPPLSKPLSQILPMSRPYSMRRGQLHPIYNTTDNISSNANYKWTRKPMSAYSTRQSNQLHPIDKMCSSNANYKWTRKPEKKYSISKPSPPERPPMPIPTINLDGSTAVMRPNSTTNGRRVLLSAKVSSRLKRVDAIMKSLQWASTPKNLPEITDEL